MGLTRTSSRMFRDFSSIFGVVVESTDQSDVEAAIAAAGNGGRVIFLPGNYQTQGLVADQHNQTWIMPPGVNFQRSDSDEQDWLVIDSEGLTIEGGKVDINGVAEEAFGVSALTGGDFTWRGGELFGGKFHGIKAWDGKVVLEETHIHHMAAAPLLWQCTSVISPGVYREAPTVRKCRIDRTEDYFALGAILINSGTPEGGGTWERAVDVDIDDNTVLMPIGDLPTSVAIEIYFIDQGNNSNNRVRGSRIGVTNAQCSAITNTGNTLRDVRDYAFEIQDGEFCTVTGNSATGTGEGECGAKLHQTATGTMRSNVVVGNSFAGGWPEAVVELIDSPGVADENYPNVIGNNAAFAD